MATLLPIPFEKSEYEFLTACDRRMAKLMERIGTISRDYEPDCFSALLSSIVSQQLSGKVADIVWGRVEALCGGAVTPEKILGAEGETLRQAGLSWNKVRYAQNIAEAALAGELVREELLALSDEAVTDRLVQIKGVGRWTAEMFLIFCLGRKDVMSLGDFGIRRGLSLLYFGGVMQNPPALASYAERFSPCRTLASMFFWETRAAITDGLGAEEFLV